MINGIVINNTSPDKNTQNQVDGSDEEGETFVSLLDQETKEFSLDLNSPPQEGQVVAPTQAKSELIIDEGSHEKTIPENQVIAESKFQKSEQVLEDEVLEIQSVDAPKQIREFQDQAVAQQPVIRDPNKVISERNTIESVDKGADSQIEANIVEELPSEPVEEAASLVKASIIPNEMGPPKPKIDNQVGIQPDKSVSDSSGDIEEIVEQPKTFKLEAFKHDKMDVKVEARFNPSSAHIETSYQQASVSTPQNNSRTLQSPILQQSIETPVGEGQWKAELSDKMLIMVAKGAKEATINVDPAELGPIEVKLSMRKDIAHINFTADFTVVRNAIESSIEQLRSQLQEQGLDLGDVSYHDRETHSEQNNNDSGSENVDSGNEPESVQSYQVNGLVDLFA